MQETILVIYLVVSIALIGIILLQQGKGAEMGASFGAGGANTVFGSAGAGNVLTKTTTILAILFFATAMSISYFNSEAEIKKDAILDEKATAEMAAEPKLEEQLPQVEAGLESETAPAQTVEQAEAVEADSSVQAEESVAEEKQESEQAAAETTESDK